uniref:Cytochrome c domain-containing protein n=1 Tax=Noctiluca scintillans TaxID=2966 RepID=A0A7S1AFN6_NOCSC|mmetsp:Transcript_44000/g.116375  ORF Transcript_44000/g.116375 Transcript_44000/m.116375 type:complete len:169 (+) Transcript_44000:49-555(+)|eukprot:CAMPEP_0194491204 /NCGR_PEP_ID=MMETSP0253-20130528/10161_1 /TAXON_ID=2966 /ORGANISM="Noctiluca scintillans" /LENGTH=168 /DNA_ID=CAMNT_0039331913 /DNA_START=47 /DNA_END=553 /DNA_ORIENTATION=-
MAPNKHLSRFDFEDCPDDFELPSGDLKRGRKMFKKYCQQCHSIYPDNRTTETGQFPLGPTLFNIYGRASGQAEIQQKGHDSRVSDILWTEGPLMNYMKNPREIAQGNIQMNFRGITDFQVRVDIVHYLKTLDWTNEKILNPPERPSSLAPLRWYQMYQKSRSDGPKDS